MIEAIFLCVIIALWMVGGQVKNRYRDVPVPLLLALYLALKFHAWWLFIALSATYQVIRLGYGAYDPEHDSNPSTLAALTGDRQGWYIRALWGLIVGAVGALPLVLGHFMGVCPYLAYILTNAVVNFLVCRLRLWVYFSDFFVALAVGSVIFI
jgi:hypothetical protein